MKRLEEYTNEELATLTDEQEKDLIDLECAHEGIRLLPELSPKPKFEKPGPDMTAYHIEDIYLLDMDEANDVLAYINSKKSIVTRNYHCYEEYKIRPATAPLTMSTVTGFSDEHHAKVKYERERIKNLEDSWDEEKSKYDEILKSRQDVSKKVQDACQSARTEKSQINALLNEYRRYLKLAMNEKEIAQNFLREAHRDRPELVEKVIKAHCDDIMIGKAA